MFGTMIESKVPMFWEEDYCILKSNHLNQGVPLEKAMEMRTDQLMASLQVIWSPFHYSNDTILLGIMS